ncbi:MAG: hypothetical protein K5852_10665 [Eubacterium sp.]|nr:hypothetical protein [Eubacterium sp.]
MRNDAVLQEVEIEHALLAPLRRIADFMPDCEPGDKQKFINIAGAFSNMPGIRGRDSFAPLEQMLF